MPSSASASDRGLKITVQTAPYRLVIVQPALNALSETFIRAHAERLPARVTVVHGDPAQIGDEPVLSQSLWPRGWRKVWRVAAGRPDKWETRQAYLKVLRGVQPHAVLAEYGHLGAGLVEPCRLARVPLVVHFHGCDASRRAILEAYAEDYRRLFEGAAAVVAVSRAMQAKLVSLGAPEQKVHYNPYGVDCSVFTGANPREAPPVFLAVGRFVEKKAPHLTLLAFARAFAERPEARLRMIGEGPLLGVCHQLADGLGISEAVEFLGPEPHAVVQKEMRAARAFVQHSIEASDGDCEGTPVSVLEASASGLPIVSTRHAGIPDVVVDETTGLLVAERDVSGMARQILRLVEDRNLASRFGEAGRKRIMAEFSMERSIRHLWSIIENCIHIVKSCS